MKAMFRPILLLMISAQALVSLAEDTNSVSSNASELRPLPATEQALPRVVLMNDSRPGHYHVQISTPPLHVGGKRSFSIAINPPAHTYSVSKWQEVNTSHHSSVRTMATGQCYESSGRIMALDPAFVDLAQTQVLLGWHADTSDVVDAWGVGACEAYQPTSMQTTWYIDGCRGAVTYNSASGTSSQNGDFHNDDFVLNSPAGVGTYVHQTAMEVGGGSSSYSVFDQTVDGNVNLLIHDNIMEYGPATVDCNTFDPNPRPPDGGHGDTGTPGCSDFYSDCGLYSFDPLVLNLANAPLRLTGMEAPVLFDISGSGTRVAVAWTRADDEVGFLVLDRNHNGIVDDGTELFGNRTRLATGELALNGFIALAGFDVNRDGKIDSADPVWSSLQVWVDRNHDGVSESSEISDLGAAGITALNLDAHATNRHDRVGNQFSFESIFQTRDRGAKPYYDVFLARQ